MPTIDEIANEISQIIPKIIRYSRSGSLSKIKVTASQMVMLVCLHEHGECNAKTLAKERGISPPTVTGIVSRLVRTGYVRRTAHPEDRRAVMLSLTKKGEDVVKNYIKTIRVLWKNMLSGLTPEERMQYLNILKKIVANISKHNG